MQDRSPKYNTNAGPMFSKDDTDFIDFLFGKLTAFVDVEELDLHDDDTCCDHLELKAAELEMTVDEMLLIENTHPWIIMNEVMLDRWLLENIDQAEVAWDNDVLTAIEAGPVEELSPEALKALDW